MLNHLIIQVRLYSTEKLSMLMHIFSGLPCSPFTVCPVSRLLQCFCLSIRAVILDFSAIKVCWRTRQIKVMTTAVKTIKDTVLEVLCYKLFIRTSL